MCEVLDVSRSGYYAWRTRPASVREMADADLVQTIRRIFADSRQTYGYESIWRAIRAEGRACGKQRVRRLMRREGLVVKQTQRYKRTTRANPKHQPAPNLPEGDFEAEQPNSKWCADITHIPTQEGALPGCHSGPVFAARCGLGDGGAHDARAGLHRLAHGLAPTPTGRLPDSA